MHSETYDLIYSSVALPDEIILMELLKTMRWASSRWTYVPGWMDGIMEGSVAHDPSGGIVRSAPGRSEALRMKSGQATMPASSFPGCSAGRRSGWKVRR